MQPRDVTKHSVRRRDYAELAQPTWLQAELGHSIVLSIQLKGDRELQSTVLTKSVLEPLLAQIVSDQLS